MANRLRLHSNLPVNLDSPNLPVPISPQSVNSGTSGSPSKRPRTVLSDLSDLSDPELPDLSDLPDEVGNAHPHTIFAFSPNRDTLGATSYFIVEEVNILVDCPAWDDANRDFLRSQGGVRWLFLTHRGGIGKAQEIQQEFNCEIVIQEQEAYLLPDLTVTPFQQEFTLTAHSRAIWTPGHSPGSACLYHNHFGGVLFTGRHLLPSPQGTLLPFKTAKTFHWRRQLQSLERLKQQFNRETLAFVCPGANTGFLRGKLTVPEAYQALTDLAIAP